MAEIVVAGIVVPLVPIAVSLLQQIPALLIKLRAMLKQAKATEGEFRELDVFLHYVREFATRYQNECSGTKKSTTIGTTTPSFLEKTLDDVQKTLDKWSSQKSGFFSRSAGDREKQLQDLRRNVQEAIHLENHDMMRVNQRVMKDILAYMKNNDRQAANRHPPTKPREAPQNEEKTQTTTTRKVANPPHAVVSSSKPHTVASSSKSHTVVSSGKPKPSIHNPHDNTIAPSTDVSPKSNGRVSENSIEPKVRKRSQSVRPDLSHRIEKGHTEKLWVRLDSEKQAKDMDTKLKELPDVKSVKYNLGTHEVWVELGAGSKVGSATLCNTIQHALPKGKLPPTRWSFHKSN